MNLNYYNLRKIGLSEKDIRKVLRLNEEINDLKSLIFVEKVDLFIYEMRASEKSSEIVKILSKYKKKKGQKLSRGGLK